jgi:hypothetical protein
MTDRFVGIDLRLVRAAQQLELLQEDIDAFFTLDRRIVERAADENGGQVSRIRPHPIPRPSITS